VPSLWQLQANYRKFSEGKKQRKNISFSPIPFSIFFFRSLLSSFLPPKLTVLNTRIVAAYMGNWQEVKG
jgi:hypothetical protein